MKKIKAMAALLCSALAVFSGPKAEAAQTEVTYERLPEAQVLWETPGMEGNIPIYYRIPAFATANDGRLIAVSDKRYWHAGDLGGHRIDILVKTSSDNGTSWSAENNLTESITGSAGVATGFGDAAIVADRESDKVLMLTASGTAGFFSSTRENKLGVHQFISNDGGVSFQAPVSITDTIYGFDESWPGLFVGSGRIMQSRYIKVGSHYRIYCAISTRNTSDNNQHENWVIYSDDFGGNWNVLGGVETAPIAPADEPKVEELPNGDVLIASRKDSGRYINIFSYDEGDSTYTNGAWGTQATLPLGNTRGTDGETYILYAKEKATNEYVYLALQSIPTTGNRQGVGIFYKELGEADTTPAAFVTGWSNTNFLMVQTRNSAYSTFTQQKDGRIGFFYEEGDPAYDMIYVPISIGQITNDKYEAAFMGIGSVKTPYVVDTEEKAQAVMTVYQREEVNWKFEGDSATWMKTSLETKKTEAQELYDSGALQATDTAAVALKEKIDAVAALGTDATADEIFACSKELADAMEEYANVDSLGDELKAKNAEAKELKATGTLDADRAATVALDEAINTSQDVIDTQLGEKTSTEIYALIQELEDVMQEYRRVHELDGELQAKITEAGELKEQNPLAAERSEAGELEAALETGNSKYQSGTREELETALAGLDTAIQNYQKVYQLEQNLQKKITTAEKLKAENELPADRAETVGLLSALDDAKAKYSSGTSEQLEAALEALDTAINKYQKICQLQEKIAIAERLKEENKLPADSAERIGLLDALDKAKAKMQQGTLEEQEAALKDLVLAIRVYEDASAGNFRAEARYNSYSIQISALEGNITAYNIFRSEAEDGEYTKLTTIQVEEGKQEYCYVDENVGTGTKRWYKVEAVAAGGGENVTSEPLSDIYPTGIEAVQKNAQMRQFHKGFLAGGETTFDGTRMEEAGQDELLGVADLMEGTFLISYKPEATSGRKVIFTVKKANASVGATGNLGANTGMVLYQDGSAIRLDASHGLKGNWNNAAPIGEWSTFGYVNTSHTGTGNNAYTSRNGTASLGYNREDMDGFIGKNPDLTVMTIGANKRGEERELEYVGEIAFVTITDEVFSQAELDAYTGAVNALLTSGTTLPEQVQGLEAVAGNGEVTLRWTAGGESVERYEVSMDDGETWIHVRDAEEYTFTGLEAGTEYTFLVRTANVVGSSEAVSIQATVLEASEATVEMPVFTPAGGTYTEIQTVRIETATEGAAIYYTDDGSQPGTGSKVYSGAITVDQSVTLKAIAVKDGMKDSAVAEAEYVISIPDPGKETVATPTFTPGAGTYSEAKTVTISTATEGATIHYTMDGSEPDASDAKYSKAITVDKTMTIKAIAVKDGMNDSAVATAKYTISIPSGPDPVVGTVEAPTFSVAAGTYTEAQSVELSTKTAGAAIYYTTDGTAPTTASTKYSKAITVDKTMTIKAIAVKAGMKDSAVATAAYTINIPATPPADKPWIFIDVDQIPEHWKYESVKYVYNNDIMGAITGTKEFQPDRPLSRSMFATVLYRMADEPAVTFEERFTDVPAGKWYSNAIIWAYSNKIVSGYTDGSFGIDDNITREQIAKMLYEYADKVCKYDVSEKKGLSEFTDADAVSNWAVEYMQWATAVGMISGKPNDAAGSSFRMDPKGEATRAECAAMLTRFQDKYNPE